ncbi:hypothetical protein F5H01DRAFT_344756 [Linnemannia elongata]|nr:hypothetical protein F5H01DRAFT_344756 [Linnemannia elongata]
MKPALDRLKEMPELIFMVASHLGPKDLHSLRLTCNQVHDICQPLFYRKLWLHGYWNEPNLLEIAKHASFIHTLKVESLTFAAYYSCMFDISQGASTSPSSASPAPTSVSIQRGNPLKLASIISRAMLEALGDLHCFPAQFLYSICPSPRLTVLSLDLVMLNTEFELNFLAKVLSSIGTLRSLTVSYSTDILTAEDVLKTLVYGCPDNLEFFSLFYDLIEEPEDYEDEELYEEDAELEETVLTLLGPVMERQEPLRRLTEWRLNVNGGNIDRDTFFSLLKFLPELTSMDVPSIGSSDGGNWEVVERVAKACPKLTGLSKHHIFKDFGGTMMIAFLQYMPANTVEAVQISEFDEWDLLDEGLTVQKESVKNIVLDECAEISVSTVSWIFSWCSALEVFRFTTKRESTFSLPLHDLVSQEWASNKFRELKLSVLLREDQEQPDEEDIVFSDPMPRWTIGLERLYRQIGALTQLRILDLRVVVDKTSRGSDGFLITYKDRTFPGFLTLEDRTAGRLGWLQLLGGLRNLEELCGSFNLDAMLEGFEFRQEEADWIVEHWPKLRFIEFYVYRKGHCITLPPPVQSMIERLPGLIVSKTYTDIYFDP